MLMKWLKKGRTVVCPSFSGQRVKTYVLTTQQSLRRSLKERGGKEVGLSLIARKKMVA